LDTMIQSFRVARVVLALFLLVVLSFQVPIVVSGISVDDAAKSVQAAQEAVSSAFVVVSDAERAGANVSGPLEELNGAVDLLSRAEIQLKVGDASGAVEAANNSFSIAEEVAAQASSLKASTLANHESSLMSSLIIFPAGIVLFLSLMVLFWRRFRRHYVRRIKDMRPVVVPDAEA
jgi:hypothetical protein